MDQKVLIVSVIKIFPYISKYSGVMNFEGYGVLVAKVHTDVVKDWNKHTEEGLVMMENNLKFIVWVVCYQ